MNLVTRIKNFSIYPGAYMYLAALSFNYWMKSLFKSNSVLHENEYNGQKILLLALYEKGLLREDIINLLSVAKQKGLYVVAVNTLKLKNPDQYFNLMDCYIERFNYGRDFGSYKTAVLHIHRKGWDNQCDRVLILNDSLFYSRKNLPYFLSQLVDTEIEVLGATENHEIEHHLGSFCLSLAGDVVRNPRFQAFWKNYSLSDIRPIVIKNGEMQLSKALKGCVTAPEKFATVFDQTWFSNYLQENPEFIQVAYDLVRCSRYVEWQSPTLKGAIARLTNKYMLLNTDFSDLEGEVSYFTDTPNEIENIFISAAKKSKPETIKQRVREELRNELLECFAYGSQIHQNGILLHYLGMPIIKLDALYRGMFTTEDVEKLAIQLEPEEAIRFKKLMYSKPFGGNVLYGWKRAAFYRGLI